jgi:hypothetical protein
MRNGVRIVRPFILAFSLESKRRTIILQSMQAS